MSFIDINEVTRFYRTSNKVIKFMIQILADIPLRVR
jgi:hypothetical protein